MTTNELPSTGVVLAGAAALGAYEVGVLSHLIETVARDIGPTMPRVLAGTSAGAINAAALASFADAPAVGTRMLSRAWCELRLEQILRPSSVELLSMALDVAGAPARLRRALRVRWIRGGVLDPAPIARLVARAPLARIDAHLAARRLDGIAVSATRVATGAAVVFHRGATPATTWSREPNVVAIETPVTELHVLASASIPLLFPPVVIDGDAYCDGGLRQMVPLSPALHLGASRLLVVNPLPAAARACAEDGDAPITSPLYLAGKALNALFADRVGADLARLNHTSAILRAGRRRYGPSFEREINLELARDGGAELRVVDALCIEPSRDLGVLAAEHVTSHAFASRASGAGRLLRCIADGEPRRAGDLLAYLLFDGAFTATLIDMGRADARARHEELCALFSPAATPDRIAAVSD